MREIVRRATAFVLKIAKMAETAVGGEKRLLENEGEGPSAKIARTEEQSSPKAPRPPKRHKYAMLLSYSGVNYMGMQVQKQTEFPTVEKELFRAMRECELITAEDVQRPQNIAFQRASRTDKGVSAVRQLVSLTLSVEHKQLGELPAIINGHMPHDVRVMGVKRATRNFNSKFDAHSRSYSYTLPTFAFAHASEATEEAYRITAERLEEINQVLSTFKGVHNFFNFTSGRKFEHASCYRYIMESSCGQPFERDGLEFVTIWFKGQSFMLHHIRKMVGLCIGVVRGLCDANFLKGRIYEQPRIDLPRAPGLGLMLEQVHFDWYDNKFAKSHESLNNWPDSEKEIEKFKEERIMPVIYETELKEKPMFEWLSSLTRHEYERTDDADMPKSPLNQAAELVAEDTKEKEENAQIVEADCTVATA